MFVSLGIHYLPEPTAKMKTTFVILCLAVLAMHATLTLGRKRQGTYPDAEKQQEIDDTIKQTSDPCQATINMHRSRKTLEEGCQQLRMNKIGMMIGGCNDDDIDLMENVLCY